MTRPGSATAISCSPPKSSATTSTLIAQHTINPHQEDLDQLEAWSAAAALAALTSRIEIIAAIKPYLYHPVVLAKLALGIENISRGRFAINLVNAWNRPEFEKAGIGFPEHDDALRLRHGMDLGGVAPDGRRTAQLSGRAFRCAQTMRCARPASIASAP